MPLPEQLLLSDLLSRRVRCDQGLEHGSGLLGWMHPPVHRLLGWASRPSALSPRRCVWRLDQLRGLSEAEALVQGEPAETDAATLERLPTLLGAVLLSGSGEPLGRLADAAVELRTGRIRHYLVARSDPRLPGGSRWRLSPDRIVDQRPGEVSTALQGLADLPLAHASVRETLLRRSRLWRDQWDEEASRLRDQWQQASGRVEQRLEGWLEDPPWDEQAPSRRRPDGAFNEEVWPEEEAAPMAEPQPESAPWEPWLDEDGEQPEPTRTGLRRDRGPAAAAPAWARRGGDSAAERGERGRRESDEWSPDGSRERWRAASRLEPDGSWRRPATDDDEESDDPWV